MTDPPSHAEPAPPGKLLIKGAAGLGNRILALLSGSLFGTLCGRETFVDWRDAVFGPKSNDATRHVNLFEELFASPTLTPWRAEMADAFPAPAPSIWGGRLEDSAINLSSEIDPEKALVYSGYRLSSVDDRRTDHDAGLIVYWGFRERLRPLRKALRGHDTSLARLGDDDLLRSLAATHLRPHAEVAAAVEAERGRYPDGPVVGLHVRQSDLKAPVGKLIDRAAAAVRRLDAAAVALATDNADVVATVTTRFGADRVFTSEKAFAVAGVPLHYDGGCGDRVSRAREALVDMLLLGHADHLVYASRSSFGYVAHVFAESGQTVTDVDRWNPSLRAKRLTQKYWA